IDIARPAEAVFDIISDTENAPLWYEAVVSAVKTTAGPIAAGTRYRLVRSLRAGIVENEVEIEEYEPVTQVTLGSVSGPTPFRYRYRLEPTATGTTRVTLTGEITVEGLPGVPVALAPVATQLFKRGMGQNLAALKRLVESS